MIPISLQDFLTILEYLVFLLIVGLSAYYSYMKLTSKEERNFYRTKIQKEITEQRMKINEKNIDSPIQIKFDQLGIKSITAVHYQFFRLIGILLFAFYYVVSPFLEGQPLSLRIIFLTVLIILTEPLIKFSLIHIILNLLIQRKRKAKIIELFTLFDLLKAELDTLSDSQEVNMYNTLKQMQPMFQHIQGSLAKFLSLWKRSPKQAKEVFYNEIGGESAKALGDILYKLDFVPKEEALRILEAESSVFSVQYYQKELQRSDKSSTFYYSFFLFTNILIVVWLIVFIVGMFTDRMNGTNTTIF